MREETYWSVRACGALALTAFLVAALWYVLGTYSGSTETLADGLGPEDLAVFSLREGAAFVGGATVGGGLIGGPAWRILVEGWDRWSITRRGALAGGLTGCFAVPFTAAILFAATDTNGFPLWEDLLAGLFVGLFGILFAGWVTVPAGAIAGYLLALARDDDAEPVWRTVGRRIG